MGKVAVKFTPMSFQFLYMSSGTNVPLNSLESINESYLFALAKPVVCLLSYERKSQVISVLSGNKYGIYMGLDKLS